MLHGSINEQGNCLDVRDHISEKKIFFTCSPSCALILGVIVIADSKLWACVTDVITNFYHIFSNVYNTKIYRKIQIENNSFKFKRDNLINFPVKCKYSKLIFIHVNLTYNVYHCVCLCGKIIVHFNTTSRIIA